MKWSEKGGKTNSQVSVFALHLYQPSRSSLIPFAMLRSRVSRRSDWGRGENLTQKGPIEPSSNRLC